MPRADLKKLDEKLDRILAVMLELKEQLAQARSDILRLSTKVEG